MFCLPPALQKITPSYATVEKFTKKSIKKKKPNYSEHSDSVISCNFSLQCRSMRTFIV